MNVGFGLQLAGNTMSGEIVVGIVLGVVFVTYVVIVVIKTRTRQNSPREKRLNIRHITADEMR
jgi:F0F1-type ATP synthase membrane subunit a